MRRTSARRHVVNVERGGHVSLLPHIFGAAQGNLPTGQRGLFCYWRTGTVVAVVNAFRYLEVL